MNEKRASWFVLLLIILAGESVFILPFVLSRVFRPTVLEVFNLDNIQLGYCFSVYGIVALVSYLFGGPLADRYPPRKLIAIALWLTALGGLVYASFPDLETLQVLYGYWGFTTIFLFWAPMIKATRVWGGENSQGKAFGFLDGGRGLVGALFGSLGVIIFSFFISTNPSEASLIERKEAFKIVIYVSSLVVAVVGFLVWVFMKMDKKIESEIIQDKITVSQVKEVLKLHSVQLLMVIVLCAYVGYKITDVFSLYAQDVLLYNQVESAKVGTFLLYIRPVVGVVIGMLADKTNTTFWLIIGFVISFFGALIFVSGIISNTTVLLFIISTLIVATGVYAARALYFSVMKKGRIPLVLTGTAVGLVSIVGYTPDIFAGPVIGYLLEGFPGEKGHQYVFLMLAVFSFIGAIASLKYYKHYHK